MIISIDAENAFGKIQHLFMIKNTSPESEPRKNIVNILAIYDRPTANILNSEKLKAFPLR